VLPSWLYLMTLFGLSIKHLFPSIIKDWGV
jgi:hypothetical protein